MKTQETLYEMIKNMNEPKEFAPQNSQFGGGGNAQGGLFGSTNNQG